MMIGELIIVDPSISYTSDVLVVNIIINYKSWSWNAPCLAWSFTSLTFAVSTEASIENLLINQDTLEVKWIEFGCGALMKESAYETFLCMYFQLSISSPKHILYIVNMLW